MFGSKKSTVKESETKQPISNANQNGINSLVKGTTIEGTITSDSDIRIDARIKGDINSKARVIIGPHGSVEGTIKCINALIEGQFDGKIFVTELLHVKETGVLNAEVQYGKLSVDPGAVYNGTSNASNSIKSQARNSSTSSSDNRQQKVGK
jgi:Integral membrane protein CcmA involved in cell shape determination